VEAGVVQIGSKVYALGGFSSGSGFLPVTHRCDVFDIATGRWSRIADLPGGAAVNHGGAATDGRHIYLAGGQVTSGYGTGTNAAFRYDTQTNTWAPFVNLPAVRFGGALAYLNGKLEYFGGDKSDRSTPQTTHWELDLSNTGAGWVTKAPLPIAADHVGHAVINGQIYAIGGEHGHHPVGQNSLVSPYVQHNYLFRYDQASDTWTRLANLPVATSHFEGGTLTINNKIVIMGGLVGGSTTHNRIQVYDPATNKWTLLKTNMPFSGDGVVSGYYGGRIYLTNGFHQAPAPAGNFTTAYWGTVSGI